MKPWQHILRDDDPIEPLTADETADMRRAVLVEARSVGAAVMHPLRLAPVFALGSALLLAVMTGVFVAKSQPVHSSARPSASGDVTQIQFATPGGTRIIWQFNPDFTMRGTHP
jgi:hypothetical protein